MKNLEVNDYGEFTSKGFYQTLESFKAELASLSVPNRVVAYIADEQLIWVRGIYFHCKELFGDNIKLNSYGIPEGYDGEALNISTEDVLSAAIAKLNRQMLNNEETTAAMGVDLNNRVSDPLPVHSIMMSPATLGNVFGDRWALCDGSQVLASDYPDLLLPKEGEFINLPVITDTTGKVNYYIKVSK